jgi:enoyl-[acyl-carrier protein] reductase/trans-2-enoyl-CoA reductase (NAD+)
MKEQGIHEGCIEQIQRLYAERLFSGKLLRMKRKNCIDDWEMRSDVQEKIAHAAATTENLGRPGDLEEK